MLLRLLLVSFVALERSSARGERQLTARRFKASFDTAASRYHSGVYSRKRIELLAKLHSTLSPFFLTHVKNLHKAILKDFRKSIQDGLKVDGYDFAKVVSETTSKAQKEFEKGVAEVKLEDAGWETVQEEQQLKEDMGAVADLLRVEETKKMVAVIEVRFDCLVLHESLSGR